MINKTSEFGVALNKINYILLLTIIILGCSTPTTNNSPLEEFFEWEEVFNLVGNSSITDIEITSEGVIFACTSVYHGTGGIFRSTDGGSVWYNKGFEGYTGKNIKIDDLDNIWFSVSSSTKCYFYRSIDLGEIWEKIDVIEENSERDFINKQVITSNSRIIVGTNGYGLYKSDNYGLSWESTNFGLVEYEESDRWANGLYYNESGTTYLCTSGNIYLSENDSDSWVKLNNPQSNVYPDNIISTFPNNLILGGMYFDGCYFSSNNGGNWQYSEIRNTSILDLVKSNQDHVYAATTNGVYKSVDSGENWVRISTGLSYDTVRCITFDKTGYLYIGMGNGKIYKSILSVD